MTDSGLLGEEEFAKLYSAADFAADFQLFLDTTLTVAWALLGLQHQVPSAFTALTACIRDLCVRRGIPAAWVYAHEYSERFGLHTHICLSLPGRENRRLFRAWARGYAERHIGRPAPRALRVRGPAIDSPWVHWATVSYLLKGYDPDAVVVSARNSPDGLPVMLGDLIAFPWRDPGPVDLKQRVGTSRSLGPDRQRIGLPTGVYAPQAKGPFRSKWADGVRDVRELYHPRFYEFVTRLAPPPRRPSIPDVRRTLPLNDLII